MSLVLLNQKFNITKVFMELGEKIKQLSVAPLLGEAISRIHDGESVSALFGFEKEYDQ